MWIKSSRCDSGTCVEVTWKKSAGCNDGACIQVGFDHENEEEYVGVRNSQMPADVIWFSRAEWTAFIAGVKNNEFDA